MDLPSKCNSTLSTSDPDCTILSPKHQGLCPTGFHIPTYAEWDALMEAVGGSDIAGSKLKAQSGWYPREEISSTDEFGFSALPGGCYANKCDIAGYYGNWWSATEGENNEGAYSWEVYSDSDAAYWYYVGKSFGSSVRCLQD
jgi:uncharacterized protein (TIGR02145 family)